MKDHNLWLALEKFEVDAGDETLTFIQRLARENGWSISFARKVFTEYKKFIFLAIISPGQVTPSDQVDQAWHLHLSYTQSYCLIRSRIGMIYVAEFCRDPFTMARPKVALPRTTGSGSNTKTP